jgi:hypothetical protein
MPLLWIASFPRSGSALTRTILWQCFGLHVSQSGPNREDKPDARDKTDSLSAFMGPRRFDPGTPLEAMVAAAEACAELVAIKTHALPHRLPRPGAPALVIVRDGRPVMTSYARFRTEVGGVETGVRAVIRGEPRDWSEHVNAWLDHDAPKLLLRYEDLRIARQEALDAIAAFLGRPQTGAFTATVEELRAIRPTHVRIASNEPGIAEVEADHAGAFWRRHGATMERLGYDR